MHWRIFNKLTPRPCEVCIVSRVYDGKVKSAVFTYMSNGGKSVWRSRHGYELDCLYDDHWCPVSSVVDRVLSMVEESLEMERQRNNSEYLFM